MCTVVPLVESLLSDDVCTDVFATFVEDIEDEDNVDEVFGDDNGLLADSCSASEADIVGVVASLVVRSFPGDDATSFAGLLF